MFKTPSKEIMMEIGELTANHYVETQEQVKALVISGNVEKLEQLGFGNLYECKKFLENVDWLIFQSIANMLVEVYNENNGTTYDEGVAILIAGLCKKEDWNSLVKAGKSKKNNNILIN